MQVETRMEGRVLVVKPLEGALDAHAAPGFKDRLAELIQAGHGRIVLDLEAVEFMDSTGLGALVACMKRLGGSGSMALCGAREPVLQVLRLTRMDRVFPITNDAGEAIAALTGGST